MTRRSEQANHPVVLALPVHLKDQQAVTFDESADTDEVLQTTQATKLTQWFAYNARNHDSLQSTYVQFPETFRWDHGAWVRRQRQHGEGTIGRVYWVSPRAGEKYFLRVLLHHVQGATGFEDMRTVEGTLCPTYRDACVKRGLLQDDAEWRCCLQEASQTQTGWQMRSLFCILLEYNHPEHPQGVFCNRTLLKSPHFLSTLHGTPSSARLWMEFKAHLMEDKVHVARRAVECGQAVMPTDAELENEALWDIEQMLNQQGRTLAEFTGMPFPHRPAARQQLSRVRLQETLLIAEARDNMARLEGEVAQCNPEQRAVFEEVTAALELPGTTPTVFFLYASGGCGKTFLLNLLLRHCRSKGHISSRAVCLCSNSFCPLLHFPLRLGNVGIHCPPPLVWWFVKRPQTLQQL